MSDPLGFPLSVRARKKVPACIARASTPREILFRSCGARESGKSKVTTDFRFHRKALQGIRFIPRLQRVGVALHRNSEVALPVFCPAYDIALNECVSTEESVLDDVNQFVEKQWHERFCRWTVSV